MHGVAYEPASMLATVHDRLPRRNRQDDGTTSHRRGDRVAYSEHRDMRQDKRRQEVSKLWNRVQKLRDGRGWYPCYPSVDIGATFAQHGIKKGFVMFKAFGTTEDDIAACCDYCEWKNRRKYESKKKATTVSK